MAAVVFILQKLLDNVEIVDYEYETGEPKRGPDGLCIGLPNGINYVIKYEKRVLMRMFLQRL